MQSPPRPPLLRSRGNRALLGASAATAVLVVAIGTLGTFGMRGWGRVPFSVPSVPWYHAWPYYLFWAPRLDRTWAELVLPVAVLVAAGLVAAAGLVRARRAWLAGSLVGAFALDLAMAALAGGPRAWQAPLAASGEYPRAVPQVGAIPTFLHDFATRVPGLPDYAAQHPPGATLFYVLVARVWPGLGGAAVATVAAACLGLLVVAALARDELRMVGERWAVVCWALAPAVVLYAATSADAMWAPVLAGAALAAHRGLMRRSLAWTVAGGALLWLASMMTFAAVLLLPFLAVRAIGLAAGQGSKGGSWVVRWAAITTATVLALAALLWLATGYDLRQPARRRPVGPHQGRGRADVAVPGALRRGRRRPPAAALARQHAGGRGHAADPERARPAAVLHPLVAAGCRAVSASTWAVWGNRSTGWTQAAR